MEMDFEVKKQRGRIFYAQNMLFVRADNDLYKNRLR